MGAKGRGDVVMYSPFTGSPLQYNRRLYCHSEHATRQNRNLVYILLEQTLRGGGNGEYFWLKIIVSRSNGTVVSPACKSLEMYYVFPPFSMNVWPWQSFCRLKNVACAEPVSTQGEDGIGEISNLNERPL